MLNITVKMSVSLIKLHTMKPCGVMEVRLHAFLTSTIDGCTSEF